MLPNGTSTERTKNLVLKTPKSAELDNPFYYLENARTLILWCLDLHRDLLLAEEIDQLERFLTLEAQSQALLIRMVMRTRSLFFASQLSHYREISQPLPGLLGELEKNGLVEVDRSPEITDLAELITKSQLIDLLVSLNSGAIQKQKSKEQLVADLVSHNPNQNQIDQWLKTLDDPLILLKCDALFRRLRLMFFGNLRQTWSEFVITELGFMRFESVELTRNSRAFQSRDEVDLYLELDDLNQSIAEATDLDELLTRVKELKVQSSWLQGRRSALLYRLSNRAEREMQTELATTGYRLSGLSRSHIRLLRLSEKCHEPAKTGSLCQEFEQSLVRPIDRLHFQRIKNRIAKKTGQKTDNSRLEVPAKLELQLPKPINRGVERLVAQTLAEDPDRPVYYVENSLINGLFGLLFWPAIFAPKTGAFFNPFQSQPADLFRQGFVNKRTEIIEAQFTLLDTERYKDAILQTYTEKHGIANTLIYWPILTETLLENALSCIPATHLKLIFRRLIGDLYTHKSGFPDLIAFDLPNRSYQLIEVKGPGDRLQDNQRLWLDFFCTQGIPSKVCWVQWTDG